MFNVHLQLQVGSSILLEINNDIQWNQWVPNANIIIRINTLNTFLTISYVDLLYFDLARKVSSKASLIEIVCQLSQRDMVFIEMQKIWYSVIIFKFHSWLCFCMILFTVSIEIMKVFLAFKKIDWGKFHLRCFNFVIYEFMPFNQEFLL